MDLIIECIGEVIIEGAFEIIKNKKISKWIRYPLAVFLTLVYSSIIALILYIAILALKKNILITIVLLLVVIFLIIGTISYFNRNKKQ